MIGKRIAMRSLIHVVDKEEFTLFFSTSTEGQEIRDPKIRKYHVRARVAQEPTVPTVVELSTETHCLPDQILLAQLALFKNGKRPRHPAQSPLPSEDPHPHSAC